MPDISKLPELAALFDTTIDALLGRRCTVLEQAAAGQLEEHLNTAQVTLAEAAEAAPLLPPQQAEALAEHAVTFSLTDSDLPDFTELLPVMSTPKLDQLLQKHFDDESFVSGLLPFCTDGAIDAAAQARLEAGRSITLFLPFLSCAALLKAFHFCTSQGRSTTEFLPFLPTSAIDQSALERNERGDDFSDLLPFLSNDALIQGMII